MNASAVALALAGCLCVVAGGCSASRSPCSPADLAGIEARFSARVAASCAGQAFDDCPAVPALKADRNAEEVAAECR